MLEMMRSTSKVAARCSSASERALARSSLLGGYGAAGCPEGLMLAHGFSIEQMVELVRAGLATATAERVVAGSRKIEVARVRITDAVRRTITADT
jgi:hypothetical protein